MGGNGRLKLTGSLGEVIKESGELALSWGEETCLGVRVGGEEDGGSVESFCQWWEYRWRE